MKRFFVPFLILISSSILFLASSTGLTISPAKPIAKTSPSPDIEEQMRIEVEKAIYDKIAVESEHILGFMVSNEEVIGITFSADYAWSSAYLVLNDPITGETLPTEPGLTLARQTSSGWQAILPSDPEWVDALILAPPDLVSDELKTTWLTMFETQLELESSGPFGGYKLPWEAGKTVWLSQSVAHDQYISSGSAHYGFDFYIPQTMFNLYSSKAGTVWFARWHVENNSHEGLGNYIVIQDPTTTPTTYQLYLHLAKDSIPEVLRKRGASVVQGQFIGIADNTGQSSGHHLHFQVHPVPDSYWGTSVDITFEDVDINGGRPRRCDGVYCDRPYCQSSDICDDFESSYVSSNQVAGDIAPPTGFILEPENGVTIYSQTVTLEGVANDEDSGLEKAQFIAYIDGTWEEIGGEYNSEHFSYDWNMCLDKVKNGPVSVALNLWDKEGNAAFGLPGLTHYTKAYTCPPPPTCKSNDNQVALFADINYAGDCVTLNIGEYAQSSALEDLGDDNAESIRVGVNVLPTLYGDAYFGGRGETFVSNDSNFSDNLIGNNLTTSVLVRARTDPPEPVYSLISPEDETYLVEEASLSLSWRDPGGATEYQVVMDTPSGINTSPWLSTPVWHLDTLATTPGNYSWKVNARNCEYTSCLGDLGTDSNSFNVLSTTITPNPPVTAPFFDDMEEGTNGWIQTGLWNRVIDADTDRVHSLTHSWYYGDNTERNYKDGTPNFGDLTSPLIQLPESSENFLLKFWYRYATESNATHWDQRWVQISIDGGPFQNFVQLNDDLINHWMHPVIDISEYRGSNIQIRFHFETLDRALNDFEGFYIDDFEISSGAPLNCKDDNYSPNKATDISYGQTVNGKLCPQGDNDYFIFEGNAGDRIVVDINSAKVAPEEMDLVLFLLDNDGTSVLTEHDDEIYSLRTDPHLGYLLKRSGNYYLKVRAWAHPSVGGEDYLYSMTLMKDNTPPVASFIYPHDDSYFSSKIIAVSVSATDNKSGISHVEFLWHSSYWGNDDWISIGEDWDVEDGWSVDFDTSTLVEQSNMAFYANIFDWAGNWVGTGSWHVGIDRTPPVTALQPSSGVYNSTAIPLAWTSSDNLSGLDYFNIQYAYFGNEWIDYSPNPDGIENHAWFIGEPASIYEFRMRGTDQGGNTENYPASAEVTSVIPAVDDLCANPDNREVDNGPALANLMTFNDPEKTHNICNPLTKDHLNDEDWIKIYVRAGRTYEVNTAPVSDSPASLALDLFADDGVTLLASASAENLAEPTNLSWTADRTGFVYIRMGNIDANIVGEGVAYNVGVYELVLYMPMSYKNQSNFHIFENSIPGVQH